MIDFTSWAHEIVERSLEDVQKEHYLTSWGRSLLARICFVADSVLQFLRLIGSLLKTGFSALEALYTWGNRGSLTENRQELSQRIHNLLFSLFGMFTPYYATQWKDVSLLEKLDDVAHSLLPSRFTLSASGFPSCSWTLPRKSHTANIKELPKE